MVTMSSNGSTSVKLLNGIFEIREIRLDQGILRELESISVYFHK